MLPGHRDQGLRRLKYEEGFFLQMLMALRRGQNDDLAGVQLVKPGEMTRIMVDSLPFSLTQAQRRVLGEALADMRSGRVTR